MSFIDLLDLKNAVTITKTIFTNDNKGGSTSVSYITPLPLCSLWQNSSSNRFISDKYAKDSSHVLCFPYGDYFFNNKSGLSSNQTIIETVQYNGENYKLSGFSNNVMQKNKIVIQGLERIS